MNIIDQIRAEILRLIETEGAQVAIGKVLTILDTLKEPIDKWSNKERKARVKKIGEIVCGFTDGQGHFDIPTDYNEFIRYNLDELEFDTLKEQPVCEDFDLESDRFFRKLPLRANTPPIPDEYIDEETFDKIARHFAQWGAEHCGSSEKPNDHKGFPTTDEEMEKFLASHPKVEAPDKYKTPDWLFKQEKSEIPTNLDEERWVPTPSALHSLYDASIGAKLTREDRNELYAIYLYLTDKREDK